MKRFVNDAFSYVVHLVSQGTTMPRMAHRRVKSGLCFALLFSPHLLASPRIVEGNAMIVGRDAVNSAPGWMVSHQAGIRHKPPAISSTIPIENFSCDGRQYCSQMHSRAEAEYFLKNCPDTKMDGDHDGIPCEHDSRW